MLFVSKKQFVFILFLVLVLINCASNAQPKVILKLDDLGSKNGKSSAAPILDYLIQMKIKTSIGVIAVKLDTSALVAYSKYINAKNDQNESLFEVWNHGLTHSKDNPPGGDKKEFQGTGYQFQKAHFNKADSIVTKLLKVKMHTFGAPYNALDSNTAKVVVENSTYKVILLDGKNSTYENGILHMNNAVNMEVATGVPNYDYFVTQYNKLVNKYPDFIVIQGHPNPYDNTKFDELKRIIAFLQSKKCEFILPYEYYAAKYKSN
jgi:peptidoglycan/xylan/chitin deacetylase (PgdA/CDA1 family)